MSLSTRITLLVLALLAIGFAAAGAALRASLQRAHDTEQRAALESRLAWIEAILRADPDGDLELREAPVPPGAAPAWQIATRGGRILFSGGEAQAPARTLSRTRIVGKPERTPVTDDSITVKNDPQEGLPEPVLAAARSVHPQLAIRRARRDANQPVYRIEGVAAQTAWKLLVSADGQLLNAESGPAKLEDLEYRFPDGGRLDLVLSASTSTAAAEQEVRHLTRTLWTVGPLALLAVGGCLALIIAALLRPLSRMARQARDIGPSSVTPLQGAGGGRECQRLREAINGMVLRLGEGLQRERHFASSAAHELRSPLAELRTSIEVALRRPRTEEEYRAILADSLAGVQRLHSLVEALLQLARTPAVDAGKAAAVPLAELLRRAARSCPPVVLAESIDESLQVLTEPDLACAALCNVLENAHRHAPQSPPEVQVEVAGDCVVVRVEDQGPGIPEADRERIFRPLTRLNPAAGEGFGLGLAVARSAMRAFGGDLTCRGRRDGARGAAFLLAFRRPLE